MARKWTPEERAAQAEKVRLWRPWASSTGPVSVNGKATSAKNRELSLRKARLEVVEAWCALNQAVATLDRLQGGKKLSGAALLKLSLEHGIRSL